MARCTDRADPRYRAIVGVLKHFVHSMAVDRDRTRPQEMLSTLSGIRTQPQNALATTGQSDGQAGQPGTTSRAYTQHSDSCPQASMRPLTIVGSWLAQPHIQQADSRNLPTRNRGIATAGNYAVVLDSQNQAWRTDISNTPNTWSAYPSVIGGIDMIAVGGDIFNFNTEWRLVALSKSYSSQYYWRQLSDLTSSWIPGNNDFDRNDFDRNDFDRNDFANTPPNLKSISCGGLDPIFVFGVLSDGNYSVTQFPNGGWWKNWHANMGPQKPTLTQMVTCNFKNYGLDASGSVFSQTLWQRSGQAVSQWHQCPAPGNQGVTLLAASKTFVFAFAIDSSLWKMDSTSGTEAWTSIFLLPKGSLRVSSLTST
ncbi:hypothetical protein BDZ45DRAFT_678354 [Acephala macrosclerotiorum]|nr:hypothetical protein BDZ45DRAFT_678354 [Acephala macrosclerotiorum]